MENWLKLVLFLQIVSISIETIDVCDSSNCLIANNCRCSTSGSPFPLPATPQLISITVEESISSNTFAELWKPLLFGRTNPDGNPIGVTFFVPHEYTDYISVQELYLNGFEIGVNSLTKDSSVAYWNHANESTLRLEFEGQRTLLSHFANIPIEDVIGAQAPQIVIEGDALIRAYISSGIQYDNTWTSRHNDQLFPYTLDYQSTQECRSDTICPNGTYPGFWIVPINNILGNNSIECNALSGCNVYGSVDYVADWLYEQVQFVRRTTRAPLTLIAPSAWFRMVPTSVAAFQKFFDMVSALDDVFFVNQRQMIEWARRPVPLSQFQTNTYLRSASCARYNCQLLNLNGQWRYMTSCAPCPEVYPWLGNPLGLDSF